MRVAIEGCAHGDLEVIYDAIVNSEKETGKRVDLLLCCGDFQATRNWRDLKCMAVPDKYKDMGTFYKYYSGEKVAPVLTIFIGGNHEASNYMQELSYGGWVAPNIYYMGYASVVNVAGVRIAGLSGIYKNHDFMKGHHEFPPYSESAMRSVYHIRNLEIFRLKQLSSKIDIFMSHDWPLGITEYGNVNALLRKKPFLRSDIENDSLGSPPAMELLRHHHPTHWFAAHLHCKFAALVTNDDNSKKTRFLALDKCLPRRKFIQIIEVEHDKSSPIELSYDLEWLTILFLSNHLLSVKNGTCYMPGPVHQGRWIFTPAEEEKEKVNHKMNYNLKVPLNFKMSVEPHNPEFQNKRVNQPSLAINEQTTEFCNRLGIDDPFALLKLTFGIVEEPESTSYTSFSSSTPSKNTDSVAEVSCSTEEEETCSFVVDTTPTIIPRVVMSSLKLPAVKNDTISLDDEISQKDISANSSKSPRKLEEEQEEGAAKPLNEPKKFKRRNQSIYTDTECLA